MASGFTEEIVKNFIIKNGCKVTNHELVTRFKSFLNDPEFKVQNREKFKDYVNTLATIKVDEKGEKVLVLKKRYRPENENQNERAMSEPPDKQTGGGDDVDGGGMSKVRSEGHLSVKDNTSDSSSLRGSSDTLSASSLTSSTTSQNSGEQLMAKSEDEGNASVISVKDRAKHLNKLQSESELRQVSETNLRRKDPRDSKHSRDKENDADDDSHSSGVGYTSYDTEEKQWLVTASSADYHALHRMLTKHPALAKVKTALHWAAKHGKPEVCKLILSKVGVDVNRRSGYTPLHLAAMHGHEHIIELLVQTYKADSNIRDYSGKKAKQYLRNSASTKAQPTFKRGSIRHTANQKLLLTRRIGSTSSAVSGRSLDDSFTRTTSFRKSNRAKAISCLIASTTSGMRKAMLRSTWTGSADNLHPDDRYGRSRSPSRTPPNSSPNIRRRQSKQTRKTKTEIVSAEYADRERMPPPSGHLRKHRRHNGVHSSKDSLSSDDGVFSSTTVTRSESEPSLQTPRHGNQTFV